jgi:hypothetical protein
MSNLFIIRSYDFINSLISLTLEIIPNMKNRNANLSKTCKGSKFRLMYCAYAELATALSYQLTFSKGVDILNGGVLPNQVAYVIPFIKMGLLSAHLVDKFSFVGLDPLSFGSSELIR